MIYHRKRIEESLALDELEMLKAADQLDPRCIYHIGKPEVETKDHKGIWTIKMPYGGKTLNYLHMEDKDTILRVLSNISLLMNGIVKFHAAELYHRDIL